MSRAAFPRLLPKLHVGLLWFLLLTKCILDWVQVKEASNKNKWRPSLVIAVEAPCPWDVWLPVHPDLPYNSLPLLEPLGSLQLFRWREHVHVERALEAPVPSRWQVRRGVPVRVWVAGVRGWVGRARWLLDSWPLTRLAVCATRDLDHQGKEGEEEAQTHTADEEQCSPFWMVYFWEERTLKSGRKSLKLADFWL